LGSTQQFTDYTGSNPNESLFYPFGQLGPQGGGAYFEGLWAGFEDGNFWSTTTGEWQTDTRRYTPGAGRWYTPDPIGKQAARLDDPQTWNMYAYARNNPTTLTDPSGLLYCGPANGGVPSCISDTEYARTPTNYGDYTHYDSSLDNVTSVRVAVTAYAGQHGNSFGHAGIGIGDEPAVGYVPADGETPLMTPGAVEPVAFSRSVVAEVFIDVTPEQADRMQGYVLDTAANPGDYSLRSNNCAHFVAKALQAGDVPVPLDRTPKGLVEDAQKFATPNPLDTSPE
jgi:RHS repeat-associated protein